MKQIDIIDNLAKMLIGGVALLSSLLILSCSPKENSPAGFILPPGYTISGQTTLAALGFINCHKVNGVSFTANAPVQSDLIVTIGGPQPRVKTYGQLVTAIIHPNAAILRNDGRYVDANGDSLMPDYTQMMAIQQMTDLVTFLQEHYDIINPVYDPHSFTYPYPYPVQ
jgi:hypothetical protein